MSTKELALLRERANVALTKHWPELKQVKGFLNAQISTKFVDGKDTGRICIAVFVDNKLKIGEGLKASEAVPKTIEGIETDVVELKPTTWKAGITGISQMSPEEQRRRSSGVRKS